MNEVGLKLSINALQIKINDKPSNSQRRNRRSNLEKKRTVKDRKTAFMVENRQIDSET